MHLPTSTMVLFSHRRLPWLSPSAATANWRANTHYYSVYQALTGDEIPSGITLLWRMNPTVKNKLQPRVWNLFSPPCTPFSLLRNICRTPKGRGVSPYCSVADCSRVAASTRGKYRSRHCRQPWLSEGRYSCCSSCLT